MSLEDLQLRFEEFDKLDQNPHQQVKSTQHVQDDTNESFEDIEIWREDVKKQKDTKEEIPHSL
jgi:DNA phosphorothioation-dependent restriction protein DptG